MAEVGKVAEREAGPIVHWFHGEAPCQLAVALRVHQSKALEVPRSKVGRDQLAGVRGAGTLLGDTHAETGQAAFRVAGTQVEVVRSAVTASTALHLGLALALTSGVTLAADAAMGVTATAQHLWHLTISVAGLALAGVAIVTWGTPLTVTPAVSW